MLTWVKINIKLKYKNESFDDLFYLKQKGSTKWLNVKRKKVRKKLKKEEKAKKRKKR